MKKTGEAPYFLGSFVGFSLCGGIPVNAKGGRPG